MKPTTDDVLKWARESKIASQLWLTEKTHLPLARDFAALAYAAGAKAMQERCADEVADCMWVDFLQDHNSAPVVNTALQEAIDAIRALGDNE